jgi:outer membrane protein assembly factor BamA
MKRKLGALFLFCAIFSNAWAIDTFLIKDIRVEGLQRISAGTVLKQVNALMMHVQPRQYAPCSRLVSLKMYD